MKMRLLNTSTISLEEFFDDQLPPYAILSHRWQADEVSFQHMQSGVAIGKAGYAKIEACCEKALKDGYEYAWVDTCCIDKSSSAELSEAINSMYRWYQKSKVCYAYLYDVPDLDMSNFKRSAWWTRGWTLQELIAPSSVVFYNGKWETVGTKASLMGFISLIAGIDIEALVSKEPEEFSVAKRMSWASWRITTRIEDAAYSLLGIFGVNMPMLYGEGEQEFIRLQEEIMKHSDDQSIFAWADHKKDHERRRGLLATSPADFFYCNRIIESTSRLNRMPYLITNMGLSIQLPVIPWAMNTYLAALDCKYEGNSDSRQGIFLEMLLEGEQCARVSVDHCEIITFKAAWLTKSRYKNFYIRQAIRRSNKTTNTTYGFYLRHLPPFIICEERYGIYDDGYKFQEIEACHEWDEKTRILRMKTGAQGVAGIIWYSSRSGLSAMKLSLDMNFNPVCEFGGNLFCPSREAYNTKSINKFSFNTTNESTQVIKQDDWTHLGHKAVGISRIGWITKALVKQRLIEGKLMWVVDLHPFHVLEGEGSTPLVVRHKGVTCDGCDGLIYSTRFKCMDCPDFDYCINCAVKSDQTHPLHSFQAIEVEDLDSDDLSSDSDITVEN